MSGSVRLRRLDSIGDSEIAQLTDVLCDCVAGGASVGFMHPLSHERAMAFWRGVAGDIRSGARALIVAEDDAGIVGTVQVILAQPDNQPHRGDIAKMLVHRRGRKRGLGDALLKEAERVAAAHGKTLLVLDTITDSDGARLYARGGWVLSGQIPDYALMPMGGLAPTSVYYRRIGG